MYDTPRGLAGAVGSIMTRRGAAGDPLAVARLWRTKHREYLLTANSLDREPASNRRAIEVSARYVFRSLDPPLTPEEVAALTGAWEQLPPWPETAEVLIRVRRSDLILATLSNGDEDMLRALLANLPVTFDHIISTEGGRFKPHPSVYRRALDVLGTQAADLLHVAGAATDAAGATAAGIRTVWVNRQADAVIDSRFTSAHQVNDLHGVLPLLDLR